MTFYRKRVRTICALLAAALMWAAAGLAEQATYAPGPERVAGGVGYGLARALVERYDLAQTGDLPLYAPARPQPMNAYMTALPQCQVGIDGDGMYLAEEKGLVPELTEYLQAWMADIEGASGGLIRFVADPDDADVLVGAAQTFRFYGNYTGEGRSAEGYACVVTLTAARLTAPEERATLTAVREPDESEVLTGGARFWKTPPTLAGTDRLADFVAAVLGWYGGGARKGDAGSGVRALQQALADRGFLADGVDGAFGGNTEAAVKRLQAYRGLEETGVVDSATLLAAYY